METTKDSPTPKKTLVSRFRFSLPKTSEPKTTAKDSVISDIRKYMSTHSEIPYILSNNYLSSDTLHLIVPDSDSARGLASEIGDKYLKPNKLCWEDKPESRQFPLETSNNTSCLVYLARPYVKDSTKQGENKQ